MNILAIIVGIVIIVVMVRFEDCLFKEEDTKDVAMICAGVAIIVALVAIVVALKFAAGVFLLSVLRTIPWLLLILAAGIILYNYMGRNEPPKRKPRSRKRRYSWRGDDKYDWGPKKHKHYWEDPNFY